MPRRPPHMTISCSRSGRALDTAALALKPPSAYVQPVTLLPSLSSSMLSLSPSLEHISSGCPQGLKCTRCASFPGKCKWVASGRGGPPRTARFENLCSTHWYDKSWRWVFLSNRQAPVVRACVNKVKKIIDYYSRGWKIQKGILYNI